MTDESGSGVRDDVPPVSIGGAAGLTGRQQIVRIPEEYDDKDLPNRALGQAMPASCKRVMSSPLPVDQGGGCPYDCPGRQRDGGCLLDVVRAARAAGVRWKFDVDPHDHYWDYDGDPIPGFETQRGDFGQIHTRWEEGHAPPDPFAVTAPEPQFFDCPHCGETNEQNPDNFHWWCGSCGKNAREPKET